MIKNEAIAVKINEPQFPRLNAPCTSFSFASLFFILITHVPTIENTSPTPAINTGIRIGPKPPNLVKVPGS